MNERNYRPVDVECCGTCRELRQDDMSGHYYCGVEEDLKIPVEDWIADFDPMEGEQWQYVCDAWSKV